MNIHNETVSIIATAIDTVISQKKSLTHSFKQHNTLRLSKFDLFLQSGVCIASSITFKNALHLTRSFTDDVCVINFSGMEVLS